ncbi:MAG TPA: aldose epimerase family protein [Gemmataceae bacterium]|nr:aldose epimerase family protein [Gemmataceae bacterium]
MYRYRWVAVLVVLGALAAAATSAAQSRTASAAAQCNTSVTSDNFGTANSGPYGGDQTVWRYTLTNSHCMQVRVITYGATVQSIEAPDRNGHLTNVALGFNTLADYVNLNSPPPTSPNFGGPYFGETIGRYANRIGGGSFKLNGATYTLPVNNGPNTLHGGFVGWGNRIWQNPTTAQGPDSVSVTMTLVAPNGDEGSGLLPGTNNYEPNCSIPSAPPVTCTGFPAQVTTQITYTLDNAGRLRIHYEAHNDDPRLSPVINLTNHSYFNLAGEGSGPAYAQRVLINADAFTPIDANLIPTGVIVPVAGTPFDFRSFHTIGERIGDVGAPQGDQLVLAHGYDHNWVLNKTGPTFDGLRYAAEAVDPGSGRQLTVWTDQPGVQFYSGNFLDGHLVGISGHTYPQGAGYTFETQHFPNSPNQPNFPSTVLQAGQTLNSTTIFAFGTNSAEVAQAIADLQDLVASMHIQHGITNALNSKLQNALDALDSKDGAGACYWMQSFLDLVNAQTGKKISSGDAQQLTDAANDITQQLGC